MQKDTLYFDSECSACTYLAQCSTKSGDIIACPIKSATNPLLVSTELGKELHFLSDGQMYLGSDAVVELLAQRLNLPRLRSLNQIGPIHSILSWMYRWIADRRHRFFGTDSFLYYNQLLVSIGLVVGILLSKPLWLGPRSIDPVPVSAHLQLIPLWIHALFAYTVMSALMWSLFAKRSRPSLLICGALAIPLFALDQLRWQPWVYIYTLVLCVVTWANSGQKTLLKSTRAQELLCWIFGSVYLYSGLQKATTRFLTDAWPWMIEPITHLPILETSSHFLWIFGLCVPFIETTLGIGLLITRTRRLSAHCLIMMHVFILLVLGPIGHNWNKVVWPWNIVMIGLLFLVKNTRSSSPAPNIFSKKYPLFQGSILVLTLIAPGLSFFNAWDMYLSFALYSGNTDELRVYTDTSTASRIDNRLEDHLVPLEDGRILIDVNTWTEAELGVLPYPERRVLRALAQSLCRKLPTDGRFQLELIHKSSVTQPSSTEFIICLNKPYTPSIQ